MRGRDRWIAQDLRPFAAPFLTRRRARLLAAEEREHVAVLLTELERWREGKPGLS
jgi:hypothetical protein